jgi:outer membrane receptor for ferrienterochelin and colicin
MRSSAKKVTKHARQTLLSIALGACFVGGVQAQSNTSGAIAGTAGPGDQITVTNPGTGFSRTISANADGSYRFSALPTGRYTVTRKAQDGSTSSREVSVNVGVAANASFVSPAGASGATTLDTITVTGGTYVNPIDVTSVESTTILTAEQIAKIPVPRDTTSVALLAPGTVRGDAAFGNLASFGGASVAENQYFVNGFNITNSFRSINFSQVPFEAIQEQQIKTGGYGAEFGRSLGGVVNQVTKRGSNEFHAGANVFWSPKGLNEPSDNQYLRDGTLLHNNSGDTTWSAVVSAWASGALIKDKLFAYALISYNRTETNNWGGPVGNAAANVLPTKANSDSQTKTPTWLLKMDWNITDSHLLELTAFSDKQKQEIDVYSNDFFQTNRLAYRGTNFIEQGGNNYVLKYTGFLTDAFTLSALYGHGEFSRGQHLRTATGEVIRYTGDLNQAVGGCPDILDIRPAYRTAVTGTYPVAARRFGRHPRSIQNRCRVATGRPPAACRLRPG